MYREISPHTEITVRHHKNLQFGIASENKVCFGTQLVQDLPHTRLELRGRASNAPLGKQHVNVCHVAIMGQRSVLSRPSSSRPNHAESPSTSGDSFLLGLCLHPSPSPTLCG